MSQTESMADRHGRILARLGELALSLAEDLHRDAEAAETPEARAVSAVAFHRIGRGLRQTLALEARLQHDRDSAGREAAAQARKDRDRAVSDRQAQVRAAVGRLIWTEHEGAEAEGWTAELDERLDEDALYEDTFLAGTPEAHIARLTHDLGFASSPIPPPPGEGDPAQQGGGGFRSDAEASTQTPDDGPPNLLSGPPQSLRDSSPDGGATDRDDRDFWNSA